MFILVEPINNSLNVYRWLSRQSLWATFSFSSGSPGTDLVGRVRQDIDETQIRVHFLAQEVTTLAELIQVGLDPHNAASGVDIELIRSESAQFVIS